MLFWRGLVLFVFVWLACVGATSAQAPAGSAPSVVEIKGSVLESLHGAGVSGAAVLLKREDGSRVASTKSDASGGFVFRGLSPGVYMVVVTASGYQAESTRSIVVLPGEEAQTRVVLRASAKKDSLREIGRIDVRYDSGQLQSTSVVTRSVSPQNAQQQNDLRVGDALAVLPGVNQEGSTTAVGDDAYINIRGLDPSESQVLLDGHPIGPIGVGMSGADPDGVVEGFNFQDAPTFALGNVAVTYGSGASGLYGVNSVGGTIDLQTINPTKHPELLFKQGLGDEGRQLSVLQATGMRGKLGYALVHGVQGTYGLFPGDSIAQTGLRGTDFTTQTLHALTYPVSGAYVLRDSLGKVTYALSPVTKASFTAYDATSWADKTGEGDNDFNSFSYVLAGAPVGADPSCPSGVLVRADGGGQQCISASAYAAGASGPAGGGPGAWQALRNQDYHARLTTAAGKHQLVLDAFTDNYAFTYHREASAENGPLGVFFDRWATQGLLMSDDVVGPNNQFGFGFYTQRQRLTGNQALSDGSFQQNAPASRNDDNYFVRDVLTVSPKLSFTANAWYEKSTLSAGGSFTPRLSVVYRPSPDDVVRVTGGRSVSEPSLQLAQTNLTPIGALNPDCGSIRNATPDHPAQVNVGFGPASNLQPETSTDLELAYGHRFAADTSFGVTFYDMNITDRIVTGSLAAGSAFSGGAGVLGRIGQFCGVQPDPASVQFTLTQAFNAAAAQARGIELSGEIRVSPRISLDYGYDIQSIVLEDLPDAVLATDATLVNGAQAFGVPLHKANLGLDVWTRSGFEAKLDSYFVSINNPQQLPGYVYADASFTQAVSDHCSLNLGISNVFNAHSDTYARVGLGVPYPTNPQNATLSAPFVQPFNTRYGLAPTSFTLSATIRR